MLSPSDSGAGVEHAFIEIQDTGKGLPRAQWEKIFRPGYTTRQRGWGLGRFASKAHCSGLSQGTYICKT